jgi:hypothetical protein
MTEAEQVLQERIEREETRVSVGITSHFEAKLLEIERYWIGLGREEVFERLVSVVQGQVIPLLANSPQTGRRLPEHKLESDGASFATRLLGETQHSPDETGADVRDFDFRDEVAGGYRLLYLHAGDALYLLSIRRPHD